MKSILGQLSAHVSAALVEAVGEEGRGVDPLVRAAADPKFGDYQSNVAMGLAKRIGKKPRDLAQAVCDALVAGKADAAGGPAFCDMCEAPEIAGPGFINLRLKEGFVRASLGEIPAATEDTAKDRLGIEPAAGDSRDTVVIDYSSPNVAKQMHVGHLRSTIIGDTIARVLEFEGHEVRRQNHIGDWGTQFGMVILAMWHICMARERGEPDYLEKTLAALAVAEERGDAEVNAILERVVNRHQEDYDRDKDGKALFGPFVLDLKEAGVSGGGSQLSLGELLPAYQFVNRVETLAKKRGSFKIRDRHGIDRSYDSLSRHVTTMLQDQEDREKKDNKQEFHAWEYAVDVTVQVCGDLYSRMNITLSVKKEDGQLRGESFYNPLLAGVGEELQAAMGEGAARPGSLRAVCREDNGALCVFLEDEEGEPAFKNQDGDPLPMIIRKSDGAYLYSTTDLAAAAYRINDAKKQPIAFKTKTLPEALKTLTDAHGMGDCAGLGGSRLLYVVGSPQKLHFQMLFAAVEALGWTMPGGRTSPVRMEHVAFGSVLGADRKMLKTRSGENVKLKDLLDEAVSRAEALVRETEADPDRRRGFGEDEIRDIAETVGIGAVKYADLAQNRNTDYVFNWDKMLALQGNTAPYMLYAYARIRSIYRKGEETGNVGGGEFGEIQLSHPAERALGLRILQLAEVLDSIAENLLPNVLCEYLYDLAGRFMTFYEACPVLQAPDEASRASRLRLCELTARSLQLGLGLLGIRTLERM